jgi:hypothetical protein
LTNEHQSHSVSNPLTEKTSLHDDKPISERFSNHPLPEEESKQGGHSHPPHEEMKGPDRQSSSKSHISKKDDPRITKSQISKPRIPQPSAKSVHLVEKLKEKEEIRKRSEK